MWWGIFFFKKIQSSAVFFIVILHSFCDNAQCCHPPQPNPPYPPHTPHPIHLIQLLNVNTRHDGTSARDVLCPTHSVSVLRNNDKLRPVCRVQLVVADVNRAVRVEAQTGAWFYPCPLVKEELSIREMSHLQVLRLKGGFVLKERRIETKTHT